MYINNYNMFANNSASNLLLQVTYDHIQNIYLKNDPKPQTD